MPEETLELLKKGIEANNADKFRRGSLISLPSAGSLIVTGDIHGHKRNFERIVTYADLENNPDRHVILQEIIHGGPEDAKGGCLSYRLLFEVISYKLRFPDRVHIIMGNHDTAVISKGEVMKNGREMNQAMRGALQRQFRLAAEDIELALRQYLFSQPLAVKTETRLWISHSLPSDRNVKKFDPGIFERNIAISDLIRPRSGYLLTWGRKMSPKTLDTMARMLDVDIFILGHQPQESGWDRAGDNLIILASDHNHGVLLPIDLTKTCNIELLIDSIVPIASIS